MAFIAPNISDRQHAITIIFSASRRPTNATAELGNASATATSRRIRLCEECQKQGRLTPAEEVHHILPLSHGGTNNTNNLMALCKPCHSRITVEMGDRWHDW